MNYIPIILDYHLNNLYVNFEKEIDEISYGLTNFKTVLLIGQAGMGKSTLCQMYANKNPLNFKIVEYYKAIEFDFDESKFISLRIPQESGNSRLVIIDGLDEIISNGSKLKLIELCIKSKSYGINVLLTSRDATVSSQYLKDFFQVKMHGFNDSQIFELVQKRLESLTPNKNVVDSLQQIAQNFNNSPGFLDYAQSLFETGSISPKELMNLLKTKLHYKINNLETHQSGVITDVRVVNSSLTEKVKKNPKFIYQMAPRQFEEFVAELFEKEGYNVTLTKQTRDGGKDLLIIEKKILGNFIIYVECKKYSMNNPVGVGLVRELYGTVVADRATAGILVTSSFFTNPAIEFTEKVKSQLSLLDYYDLKKLLDEKITPTL